MVMSKFNQSGELIKSTLARGFIHVRRVEATIYIAVSEEAGGDAEIPLTVTECMAAIDLMKRAVESSSNSNIDTPYDRTTDRR
jgi:hypothetical protein